MQNEIRVTDVEMQDVRLWNLGDLTEASTTIFQVVPEMSLPYEKPNNIHLVISFEFDLNKYSVEREVLTVFESLGEIGGLYGMLLTIGLVCVTVSSGNGLSITLIKDIFQD